MASGLLTSVLVLSTALLALGANRSEWANRTIYFAFTDRVARSDGGTRPCDNFGDYCGGTWEGLADKLDYIQDMGFDAVWITPVVENLARGYHGYWTQNLTNIEPRLGGEKGLKKLIGEVHKRGMWIMVDVVANHVAPIGTDYGRIYPFAKAEHYHSKCDIDSFVCHSDEVTQCRLADLPDLNQEHPFVRNTLLLWIEDLVKMYNIDGLRVDTIMEVSSDFWKEFNERAGVYMVGELMGPWQCQLDYVGNGLDATLDYTSYYDIKDIFKGDSMRKLDHVMENLASFPDQGRYQGIFLDNHDNPRFLYNTIDALTQLKNGLTWVMFSQGIPIVYYGTEQGYAGGPDPGNREPLWTSGYSTDSEMYKFVKALGQARQKVKPWNAVFQQVWRDDHIYAFTKDEAVIVISNEKNDRTIQIYRLQHSDGTVLCNLLAEPGTDCTTVWGNSAYFHLNQGLPAVYFPVANKGECVIRYSDRQECGSSGITPEECRAKGCCFEAGPSDHPWCFKKPSGYSNRPDSILRA